MRRDNPTQGWISAACVVTALGLALLAVVVRAQDGSPSVRDPRVFAPASLPFGKGYGEWSAEWWQWVLSIPASDNPQFDETGEKCAVGQRGPVWFLTGILGISATVTRRCSVPEGTALFFPILNIMAANVGVDVPMTVPELRALLVPINDGAINLLVEVDGIPIRGVEFFRFTSVVFSYTLSQHNVIQALGDLITGTPGTYFPVVDEGFYVMLKPLPVGEHTLTIHGEFPNFDFVLDVTYHLTVVPLTLP